MDPRLTDTQRTDPGQAPCAELRSKRWFFLKAPPRSAEELMDGSNWCWCNLTSGRLGPDQEPVDPDDCVAGRGCWRGLVGSRPAPS